jgi:hypothetical protein
MIEKQWDQNYKRDLTKNTEKQLKIEKNRMAVLVGPLYVRRQIRWQMCRSTASFACHRRQNRRNAVPTIFLVNLEHVL